ncbi:MAG: CotH kinase family protein [Acidobacteria bacterium]|nr:CotH kinase family protein [Acidobacteriota bacterium]
MRIVALCRAVRLGLAVIVWGAAVCGGGVATAQALDELFDDRTVHEVRLSINERDLRELRERYLENVYVPADVQWRGERVRNAGVRSRGLASRSATKLGLRIDFNRYAAGQRFLGVASLVLDNLVTDPALVRERVSMAVFARLGQPAPRESFARVYINDRYEGLYAVVEAVDGGFLARAFGETSGYLFERHFLRPYRGEDLGDEPAYRTVFEPRTHEREADAILYAPIRALFHEVNQPADTVWRERVGRYIDLVQLVTHVAIETCLSEADGVLGYAGMANFYLYRGPGAETHRLIVWDKDHTFTAIDSSIVLRVEENALLSRALAFSDLRAAYLDALERCARLAAAGNWLESEIVRVSAVIDAAAREDVHMPGGDQTRQAAVAYLRQFARERPAFVIQEVARERAKH